MPAHTTGVPKEAEAGEKRVALTPSVVATLLKAGFKDVCVEAGAGAAAGFSVSDKRNPAPSQLPESSSSSSSVCSPISECTNEACAAAPKLRPPPLLPPPRPPGCSLVRMMSMRLQVRVWSIAQPLSVLIWCSRSGPLPWMKPTCSRMRHGELRQPIQGLRGRYICVCNGVIDAVLAHNQEGLSHSATRPHMSATLLHIYCIHPTQRLTHHPCLSVCLPG